MMRVVFLVTVLISLTSFISSASADFATAKYVAPGEMVVVDLKELLPSASGATKFIDRPSDVLLDIDGQTISFHPLDLRNGTRRVIVQIGDDPNQRARIEFVIGRPVQNESGEMYAQIGAILFQLLTVAIFLEVALTLVFKNRFYINNFEDSVGGKTVISLVVAAIVVWAFDLELFSALIVAITGEAVEGTVPKFVSFGVTALIIAGGSGSVYQLYTRLGIRPRITPGTSGASAQGQGRLIVTLTRDQANPEDDVQVMLDEDFIGTIAKDENKLGGAKGLLVNAGSYLLTLKCNNRNDQPIEAKRNVGIEAGRPEIAPVKL